MITRVHTFYSIPQYGFSTFAHRNKTFNVLQLVWQNALSEQVSTEINVLYTVLMKYCIVF